MLAISVAFSGECSSVALSQPNVQIVRPLEVEQGFGEGFQARKWKSADLGLLLWGKEAGAAAQQAEGNVQLAGLMALLPSSLLPEPKISR